VLCAIFVVQGSAGKCFVQALHASGSQASVCKNFMRPMVLLRKRLSDSKSFLACRTAMSGDKLQGDEKG